MRNVKASNRRKLLAAAGALSLSAGVFGAGANVASAAELARVRAVCEHRLCLLVLDESTDSDGDGVTDLDEEALGSDPMDPTSRPDVTTIFDKTIARELPSFEQHLTELVALPQNAPDGEALATGLGAIAVPSSGSYAKSVGGVMSGLQANGFTLGTNLTAMLTQLPRASEAERLIFAARGNVALYGSKVDDVFNLEGLVGPTNFGANGGKKLTGLLGEEFTRGDDGLSFGRGYSVRYEDGSWDDVLGWAKPSDSGFTNIKTDLVSFGSGGNRSGTTTVVTESSFTHTKGTVTNTGYDEEGNVLGSSKTEYNHYKTTDADGGFGEDIVTHTTNYDQNGEQTDRTTNIYSEYTHSDGTTKTYSSETQYDADGNQTGKTVTETTTSSDGTTTTTTTTYDSEGKVVETKTETTKCEKECQKDSQEDGFDNPDYVGAGPIITTDDMARVVVRLNSTRTPGPDSGEIDLGDVEPPAGGYDPMIAMVNPDGVVTFAVSGNPSFNHAQPRYGPGLGELVDISGVNPPSSTDPVSWPM